MLHVRVPTVIAKCPPAGVQQFVNDHFQTGDFTGYTQSNMMVDNGSCKDSWGQGIAPYIGNYDASDANCLGLSLQQLLPKPVPAACLLPTSTFSVTLASLGAPCARGYQDIQILYTDGTYTDVNLTLGVGSSWTTFDLKPYVQAGKIIRGILYTGTDSICPCGVHVGQFSLQI